MGMLILWNAKYHWKWMAYKLHTSIWINLRNNADWENQVMKTA